MNRQRGAGRTPVGVRSRLRLLCRPTFCASSSRRKLKQRGKSAHKIACQVRPFRCPTQFVDTVGYLTSRHAQPRAKHRHSAQQHSSSEREIHYSARSSAYEMHHTNAGTKTSGTVESEHATRRINTPPMSRTATVQTLSKQLAKPEKTTAKPSQRVNAPTKNLCQTKLQKARRKHW